MPAGARTLGVAVAVLNGTVLEAPVPSAPSGHIDSKTGGDKLMMRRRDFLVSAAAACLGPGLAGAQGAWPQRSISLVVPFSAGGSADLGCAHVRATLPGEVRRVRCDRKQGWRGRKHRFGARREGSPGRLHAGPRYGEHARDQSGAVCKTPVQCRNRLRTDFADRPVAQSPRHQQQASRQHRRRAGRISEGQRRQDELRVGRQWNVRTFSRPSCS